MSKDCVIYDRKCIDCGECEVCDLDRNKKCNNCCKCMEEVEEFRSLNLEEFIGDQEEKDLARKKKK